MCHLRHEFEVGVVFLSELLQQAYVLFLHVFKRLSRHFHLTQHRFLLLQTAATMHAYIQKLQISDRTAMENCKFQTEQIMSVQYFDFATKFPQISLFSPKFCIFGLRYSEKKDF